MIPKTPISKHAGKLLLLRPVPLFFEFPVKLHILRGVWGHAPRKILKFEAACFMFQKLLDFQNIDKCSGRTLC